MQGPSEVIQEAEKFGLLITGHVGTLLGLPQSKTCWGASCWASCVSSVVCE